MADEKAGGPPSRGGKTGDGRRRGHDGGERHGGAPASTGGRRDAPPGGGPHRGKGRRGGKPGFGKGPAKPPKVEIYESLKELTRGEGYRIDKFVAAEKGTHRPVKTEYRLTREGLKGIHVFQRLADAQAAAVAPLPEPEPEPVPAPEVTAELEAESAEAETAESEPETPPPAEATAETAG